MIFFGAILSHYFTNYTSILLFWYLCTMNTKSKTVQELAKAFKKLSGEEKLELLYLLPENWFNTQTYMLTAAQKKELDKATAKEKEGKANFNSWDEVVHFAKSRNNAL